MPAATRPYLSAGIALMSVGAVCAIPVEAPSATQRMATESYRLTASTSVAGEPALVNVPDNLVSLILSIPAWQIQAMDRFADAMIATGSWQVWGPTNVFGFDEQDPPKLKALIDMMVPIQPYSSELGEQASWWAKANLPMNAGCASMPGACPDLNALLSAMFKVPATQLHEGYQFPTVTNPFTGEPTSWSEQYVKLDPWAPFAALAAYLTGPRQTVVTVSSAETSAIMAKTAQAVSDAYNPFVPNSEWFNPEQTGLAPAFRAAAPNFCRSCDADNPYDNPWLYENYPPNSGSAPSAAVSVAGHAAAEATETTGATEATDTAPVNDIKFADETVEADEPTRQSQRSPRRAHRTGDTPDAADRTPGPAAAQPSAPSSE